MTPEEAKEVGQRFLNKPVTITWEFLDGSTIRKADQHFTSIHVLDGHESFTQSDEYRHRIATRHDPQWVLDIDPMGAIQMWESGVRLSSSFDVGTVITVELEPDPSALEQAVAQLTARVEYP